MFFKFRFENALFASPFEWNPCFFTVVTFGVRISVFVMLALLWLDCGCCEKLEGRTTLFAPSNPRRNLFLANRLKLPC